MIRFVVLVLGDDDEDDIGNDNDVDLFFSKHHFLNILTHCFQCMALNT